MIRDNINSNLIKGFGTPISITLPFTTPSDGIILLSFNDEKLLM